MIRLAVINSSGPAASAASLATLTFVAGLAVGAVVATAMASRVAAPAPSQPARPDRPAIAMAGGLRAEVLRVIDGDTFEARVAVWPGLDITTKVRLRGIDSPEMKSSCAEERAGALAARDALQAILADGSVAVGQIGQDKYGGRVLGSASTRTTADVSAAMLAGGHARPYSGGKRLPWC